MGNIIDKSTKIKSWKNNKITESQNCECVILYIDFNKLYKFPNIETGESEECYPIYNRHDELITYLPKNKVDRLEYLIGSSSPNVKNLQLEKLLHGKKL